MNTQKTSMAFLGPTGTFSEEAITKISPNGENIFCSSITEVFEKVTKENISGLLPLVNSIAGDIEETKHCLKTYAVIITQKVKVPVHQQLLSLEKDLSKIQYVYSHPQGLLQCKKWLKDNLPHAKLIETKSTTETLQDPKKHIAYIASKRASVVYQIPILSTNIEDNHTNTTTFGIIVPTKIELEKARKEIDAIDKKLIQLLAKRFAIVARIGVFKKENKLPIKNEKREKELLEKLVLQAVKEGMSKTLITTIWKAIFKESYAKEQL